ncbi:helix-turn-helix domain-containing protein [Aurantiacibacter sp. D1-12]|uniref:helix-turn-helix domain-containing protein n=1 Tax=Aurantiacibacter sp. D1-12 TaxID=2993658 RepID=UPI00237D31DB|nr:DUF4019 domain-containing protein [Aurantiacibacter sp. D1-12]MDE1466558.1 DUF4019 domain-containing protein [Aurantiacibacter sp. D1-12]
MTAALDSLTEKEREALRLLLAGHDAKSSARELGISVHTVNDRLRNARRKMGVSSSREAARILSDSEGTTPQSVAHNTIGVAENTAPDDPADLNKTAGKGPSRAVWLAGGMLTMSLVIAIAAVTLMTDTPIQTETVAGDDYTSEAPAQSVSGEAESITQVEEFIALVDAGDWTGSWDAAGAYFQEQTSASEWAAVVEPVRSPLGTVESREVVSVQRANSLPGVPEGEYEVVQFATDFAARDEQSIETVIMLATNDGWQVMGYFIR